MKFLIKMLFLAIIPLSIYHFLPDVKTETAITETERIVVTSSVAVILFVLLFFKLVVALIAGFFAAISIALPCFLFFGSIGGKLAEQKMQLAPWVFISLAVIIPSLVFLVVTLATYKAISATSKVVNHAFDTIENNCKPT